MTKPKAYLVAIIAFAAACSSEVRQPLVVRVVNLELDSQPADICWFVEDDEPLRPLAELGVSGVPYGAATHYLDLSDGPALRVGFADVNGSCSNFVDVERLHTSSEYQTLVLIGDASDDSVPTRAVLLADETSEPSSMGAKARVFHADPVAPSIDVGVELPNGTRNLLFEGVTYGNLASGSAFPLSGLGYATGIPAIPLPVFVWNATTDAKLLQFIPRPLAAGTINSFFPAGRVTTGGAEALLCVDEPLHATVENPWGRCELVVPSYVDPPM